MKLVRAAFYCSPSRFVLGVHVSSSLTAHTHIRPYMLTSYAWSFSYVSSEIESRCHHRFTGQCQRKCMYIVCRCRVLSGDQMHREWLHFDAWNGYVCLSAVNWLHCVLRARSAAYLFILVAWKCLFNSVKRRSDGPTATAFKYLSADGPFVSTH